MNLELIGKFIADARKRKNLTQEELAEKLGISDRAVSKWERGLNLPDASLMLELSNILGITVNELLSGKIIKDDEYMEKAEEKLLEMAKKEEEQNKKMLIYENVIGFMSSVAFLILIFTASFFVENTIVRIILIIVAIIIFIIGISFALKIETEIGYYECEHCHNKYVPTYKEVYFAMHMGRTRYLKCPACHKRSWNKKIITKY